VHAALDDGMLDTKEFSNACFHSSLALTVVYDPPVSRIYRLLSQHPTLCDRQARAAALAACSPHGIQYTYESYQESPDAFRQ
jgi:hypothetical protein